MRYTEENGYRKGKEDELEYKEQLEAYLTRNKATNEKVKSKKGGSGHTYSLAEYGLDEAGVRTAFKHYTDMYNLVQAKRK